MKIEIKIPTLPESVADATIASWRVQVGEQVAQDDVLVDIETDKIVLEVPHLKQDAWLIFYTKKVIRF